MKYSNAIRNSFNFLVYVATTATLLSCGRPLSPEDPLQVDRSRGVVGGFLQQGDDGWRRGLAPLLVTVNGKHSERVIMNCSAAPISRRVFLTAAHCVDYELHKRIKPANLTADMTGQGDAAYGIVADVGKHTTGGNLRLPSVQKAKVLVGERNIEVEGNYRDSLALIALPKAVDDIDDAAIRPIVTSEWELPAGRVKRDREAAELPQIAVYGHSRNALAVRQPLAGVGVLQLNLDTMWGNPDRSLRRGVNFVRGFTAQGGDAKALFWTRGAVHSNSDRFNDRNDKNDCTHLDFAHPTAGGEYYAMSAPGDSGGPAYDSDGSLRGILVRGGWAAESHDNDGTSWLRHHTLDTLPNKAGPCSPESFPANWKGKTLTIRGFSDYMNLCSPSRRRDLQRFGRELLAAGFVEEGNRLAKLTDCSSTKSMTRLNVQTQGDEQLSVASQPAGIDLGNGRNTLVVAVGTTVTLTATSSQGGVPRWYVDNAVRWACDGKWVCPIPVFGPTQVVVEGAASLGSSHRIDVDRIGTSERVCSDDGALDTSVWDDDLKQSGWFTSQPVTFCYGQEDFLYAASANAPGGGTCCSGAPRSVPGLTWTLGKVVLKQCDGWSRCTVSGLRASATLTVHLDSGVMGPGTKPSDFPLSLEPTTGIISPPTVQPPRIQSFVVSPARVRVGERVTASWTSDKPAASCILRDTAGRTYATGSGSQQVSFPLTAPGTHTFQIACTVAGSEPSVLTAAPVVAVKPLKILGFNIAPGRIPRGGRATATWTTQSATSCDLKIGGNWRRNLSASGSYGGVFVKPGTYDLLLVCRDASGAQVPAIRYLVVD